VAVGDAVTAGDGETILAGVGGVVMVAVAEGTTVVAVESVAAAVGDNVSKREAVAGPPPQPIKETATTSATNMTREHSSIR
jgi:hypothetical protein